MPVPGVVLHPRCAGIALAALLAAELLEDKILGLEEGQQTWWHPHSLGYLQK